MSINGIGGVSSYNSYSPMNRKAAIKSVPLPNFGGWGEGTIPTKTEPTRTDEEIRNEVIELAKKDARRGVRGNDVGGQGKQTQELKNLIGEYVTSVSPDRRSIYPAAMEQMGKATTKTARLDKPINIDHSLLDLMLSGINVNLKNTSAAYNQRSNMIEIGHVEFFIGGECIGDYDAGRGWHVSLTKAEQSRDGEIHLLYHEAWTAERKAMGISE